MTTVTKPCTPATERIASMVSTLAICCNVGRVEEAQKIYSRVQELLEEVQERLEFAEKTAFGGPQETE